MQFAGNVYDPPCLGKQTLTAQKGVSPQIIFIYQSLSLITSVIVSVSIPLRRKLKQLLTKGCLVQSLTPSSNNAI